MAEGEAARSATRDYRSYSGSPWDLWDVIYGRRSHRRYLPLELTEELIGELHKTVELAAAVRGAAGETIASVTDRDTVEEIRRRSYKGLRNKINLWLSRAPLSGFLLVVVPRDDMRADRPRELPKAIMATEDCVLWLTEGGLGTCWLAGINQGEIRNVMGLGEEWAIPVAVPFGKPRAKVSTASFEGITYQALSRRRKPISSITAVERADRPYHVEGIERVPFQASAVQDVRGLLGRIGGGLTTEGDAPGGLALEACLEAARVAPSAANAQHWLFVVVREEDKLVRLAETCGSPGGWRAAVVAAGLTRAMEAVLFEKPFWMIDVPIALSNMSLMAASMGLGVAVHTDDIDEAAINGLVGFSEGARTVGVLALS